MPASDTASVLIASRGSSTFLRGYEVMVGTGEVVVASATLTAKGYPVPSKVISMTFEGATVISTTGADGSAAGYFTAPASTGTLICYLSFDGDSDTTVRPGTGAWFSVSVRTAPAVKSSPM